MDTALHSITHERNKDRENNNRYEKYAREYVFVHRDRMQPEDQETGDLMVSRILDPKYPYPKLMLRALGGFIDTVMHYGDYHLPTFPILTDGGGR